MQNFTGTTAQPKMIGRDIKSENGLQNLAEYYQSLFDIEENFNHYNRKEYRNAKRKFVKYLMSNRELQEYFNRPDRINPLNKGGDFPHEQQTIP